MKNQKLFFVLGILRLGLGWIFLWSFFDKLFGLNFATKTNQAWLKGGSPTFGFLKFGTKGPLASFYQSLAGNPVIDWLFMLSLLFIGLTLTLGIMVKLGSFLGAFLLILIYSAGSLPPEHNPFLDEHLIYFLLMIVFPLAKSGSYLGLGRWWTQTKLVKKLPILE